MAVFEKIEKVSGRAWYALGILTFVYTISFVDRQILSILAEDIKHDLGLTDAQLGFLYGTAFAIFYSLFGIPLGRLADQWNRVWLVALGLVGWSVMTAFSGFAATFMVLAIARMGVGIGEASTSPAATSLIADYFPDRRRSTALAIYASGLYIGLGLSLPIGSYLMSLWRNAYPLASDAPFGLTSWQATFVMLGVPGMLVALLVLTVHEPRYGGGSDGKRLPWREFGQELFAILPPFTFLSTARLPGELPINLAVAASLALFASVMAVLLSDPAQWFIYALGLYAVFSWIQSLRHRDAATYRLIWRTPQTVAAVVAFGSIAFITYATGFWASPYALRTFYATSDAPALVFEGMTAVREVSMIVGWGSALGSALGVVVGGMVADLWRRRDPRGRLFTIAGCLVLSAPLVILMFTTNSLRIFYLLVPIATFVSSGWTGGAIATVQDLVLPRMRATASATFLLGMTLVGLALGPYFAGKIGTLAGSLRVGIVSLYLVAPFTLLALWYVARSLSSLESTRSERAGT